MEAKKGIDVVLLYRILKETNVGIFIIGDIKSKCEG